MQTKENKIHQEEEIMKKIIRLTESDLHRLVKESVKRIVREDFGNGNGVIGGDIFGTSLNPTQERLPRGWEKIETSGGTIYTDQDGNTYYKDEYGKFQPYDMMESRIRRNTIRLTESDLHRIVKESVQKILREMDGAAIGDGSGMSSPTPTGSELADNERVAGTTSDYSNGQYTVRGVGKNNFYADADNHKDMIRKSFEGEGLVGH